VADALLVAHRRAAVAAQVQAAHRRQVRRVRQFAQAAVADADVTQPQIDEAAGAGRVGQDRLALQRVTRQVQGREAA
jgi:hypothetical protein